MSPLIRWGLTLLVVAVGSVVILDAVFDLLLSISVSTVSVAILHAHPLLVVAFCTGMSSVHSCRMERQREVTTLAITPPICCNNPQAEEFHLQCKLVLMTEAL